MAMFKAILSAMLLGGMSIASSVTIAAGPDASGYQWSPVAIGGGGFVTGLTTHPPTGRIYAFTDVGGAYVWKPGNVRWAPLLDNLINDPRLNNLYGVEGLAADPNDPSGNTLWVTLGKYGNWADCCGIFRSKDGGLSFQQMYPAPGTSMNVSSTDTRRRQGPRFAIDPNNGQVVLYGTRSEGLKITTNNGTTWNNAAGFPSGVGDINAVVFDAHSGVDGSNHTNGVWAAVGLGSGRGLYHRISAGGSFTPVTYQPGFNTALAIQHLAIDAAGNLYVSLAHYSSTDCEPDCPDGGGVWRINPSGQFTDITPVTGKAYTGIDVALGTSDTIAQIAVVQQCASYACPVYISKNGGSSYTTYSYQTSPVNMNEVVVPGLSAPWFTAPSDSSASAWSAYPSALIFDPNDTAHASVFLSDYFGVWKGLGLSSTSGNAIWHNLAANHEEVEPYQLLAPPKPVIGTAARLLVALADVDGFRLTDPTTMPVQPLGPFLVGTTSKVQTNDLMGVTSGFDFYEPNSSLMIRVGVANHTSATSASFSTDNGQTWFFYTNLPANQIAGKIALAPQANPAASVAVWVPRGDNAGVYYSANANAATATWASASGAPIGALGTYPGTTAQWNYNEPLTADRYVGTTPGNCSTTFTGCVFYLYRQGGMYRSTNKGANWSRVHPFPAGAGSSAHPWVRVIGNPYANAVGDVWVAIADPYYSQGVSGIDGLYHSTDQGEVFTYSSAVNAAYLISIGPAVVAGSAYALYLYGRLSATPDVATVYRSDDKGATWVQIYDPSVNSPVGLTAAPCTIAAERSGPEPGSVYIGTCGRGVVYGTPNSGLIFYDGFE